jgi:hypothetical protein
VWLNSQSFLQSGEGARAPFLVPEKRRVKLIGGVRSRLHATRRPVGRGGSWSRSRCRPCRRQGLVRHGQGHGRGAPTVRWSSLPAPLDPGRRRTFGSSVAVASDDHSGGLRHAVDQRRREGSPTAKRSSLPAPRDPSTYRPSRVLVAVALSVMSAAGPRSPWLRPWPRHADCEVECAPGSP